MTPVENLLDRLPGVKKSGNGWSARCPAHDDRKASLSVSEGDDGTALVKCHAGCDTAAIVAALGMKLADLFPSQSDSRPGRNGKPHRTGSVFPTAKDVVAHLERQRGKRSALWTYHDAHGQPVGVVIRWDKPGGKEILPVSLHGKHWRIAAMADPRPLYGLTELTDAKIVAVLEGEKAADAARSLGLTATTSAGGSQAADKTDWSPLAGKEVWLLRDNDGAGKKYADRVTEILAKLPAVPVLRLIELPGLPRGGDIVDWIAVHGEAAEPAGMRAEIEALAQQVEPRLPNAPDVDVILIGPDEFRVNDEATAALAREANIFQRGGLLVHILAHAETETIQGPAIRRPIGAPVIRELARPLLREHMTHCAQWKRQQDNDMVPAHPPNWSVAAVHARGQWPGIRPLDAVLTFPVMMPDGSLVTMNGYYRQARVLVELASELAISVADRPSKDDIKSSLDALFDPLHDFPFETMEHRSALLAGLLTPLAWFLFDGPAPMFLIDKNVRGAGAGLLADVVALTVTGRRFSIMSYTNDREELRKRITTLAMEGERLILLDNLAGAVGNDVLDAALTADRWKDRVLGGNRVYDGPLHVVWFGTGNNVQLQKDTPRRVCHIRMESKDEWPELRTGFRYPHLRKHLIQHRATYLSAALTLLRAWIRAGRPKHGLQPWGSFEGWSETIREVLVFAGLPDPGETRIALQTAADRDALAMTDVLRGLAHLDPAGRGLTTADIVKRLKEDDGSDEIVASMRAAVDELCGKLDSRVLAFRFRSFKRRIFKGQFLDTGGTAHGANRWVVLAASVHERGKDVHHHTHVPLG